MAVNFFIPGVPRQMLRNRHAYNRSDTVTVGKH